MAAPGEKKKILVIDDEPDLVDMLADFLTSNGFQVETAHDGREGLDRARKFEPNLIVLDMNMPRMGGISFYHVLADENHGKPKYPILVLTARADLAPLFRDLDVDGFMTKPFGINDFLEEVEMITGVSTGSGKNADEEVDLKKPSDGKRVLVVENDMSVFTKIVGVFSRAGYQTIGVRTATEAIESARFDRPDIAVIKIRLPDIAGDVLATKLRYMARTSEIPLVLYSGAADTRLDNSVTQNLSAKLGRGSLVETDDAEKLLKAVQHVLSQKPE